MDSYNLRIKKSAEKELRSIPKPDLIRVTHKIQALAKNPRPLGCQKLSTEEKYRIRQGDWRVVYLINDQEKLIEIFKISHRREIYR
ncbi:MAG: type II toxin-antitoxin system RelE/ParE family toxin [Elusimicrobia bacterium]|nr:type II toxin-antitoxin system RelE/ParE family toxin [Elusimicrobiota bacterium]